MHTLSWNVRKVKYMNYTKRLKSKLYIFYIYLHISAKCKKKYRPGKLSWCKSACAHRKTSVQTFSIHETCLAVLAITTAVREGDRQILRAEIKEKQ